MDEKDFEKLFREAIEGAQPTPPLTDTIRARAIARMTNIALEYEHRATMGVSSWEKVENAFLRILKEKPTDREAHLHLGRMYTRWGKFEQALKMLPADNESWAGINRAFCLDALERREEALELYNALKDIDDDSIARWARLGLQQPTWPQDVDILPEPGEVQLKPQPVWQVSAIRSAPETTPQAVIDGDLATRWSNFGVPGDDGQEPGQWFQVDFGKPVKASRIILDHYGVISFYTNDWPRGIKANFSLDGENWFPVETSQAGPMQFATARFAPPQMIRIIRFELISAHYPEWWSIYGMYLFSPLD